MADELQEEKGWIRELANENFLAVYDVLLDIRNEMQLSEKPRIPLWQPMIKFPILMPMDSIGHRDRYCEFRWKAVELLKRKKVIKDFKYLEGTHRWESKIAIVANEADVNETFEIFNVIYEKHTRSEDNKHEEQSTEIQAGDKLPLEPPDKVTIPWLLKHVPVMLWVAFLGLLLASYSLGVKTSHISLIRDLYGLDKLHTTLESESPKNKLNESIQQTPKSGSADGSR
jgi:hypothetical protein